MSKICDPWGVTKGIELSLKLAQERVGMLEEGARLMRPVITGPSPLKILSKTEGLIYLNILKDVCSAERETEQMFIRQPLEALQQLLKNKKYFLICSRELPDRLREMTFQIEMLNGRVERAEHVFDLVFKEFLDSVLAAFAKQS
jgi:hypothetical protein